jgi:hypothetical protein
MNRHLKKALDQIKSGKWGKAKGKFTDGEGNFCILGALTRAYEETGKGCYFEEWGYVYDEEEHLLQPEVAAHYGFLDSQVKVYTEEHGWLSVVDLNDDTEMSLPELAELIEAQADKICILEPPRKKKTKQGLPPGAAPVPAFIVTARKEQTV